MPSISKSIFIAAVVATIVLWSCRPSEPEQKLVADSIAEVQESPPEKIQQISKATTDFKLRDKKTHALHIICESITKELLDSLIISIYKFNKSNYPDRKFSVAHSDLYGSEDTRDVTIATFDNKPAGMEYYKKLMDLFLSYPSYVSLKNSSYIIHNSNASLMRQSSWKDYHAFFKEAYLSKEKNAFRNNFDPATLYSDQDTTGYYICFSADTKDSTDVAAARENIKSFNRLHYGDLSLRVFPMSLQEERNKTLYSISSFQKKSLALEYLHKITEHFALSASEVFYISRSNYFTLLQEETTEEYMQFYTANIPE